MKIIVGVLPSFILLNFVLLSSLFRLFLTTSFDTFNTAHLFTILEFILKPSQFKLPQRLAAHAAPRNITQYEKCHANTIVEFTVSFGIHTAQIITRIRTGG